MLLVLDAAAIQLEMVCTLTKAVLKDSLSAEEMLEHRRNNSKKRTRLR